MQNYITCAIINDDLSARKRLQELLVMFPYVECCFASGSNNGIIDSLLQYKPKILFVDVEMEKNDGFSFLQKLKNTGLCPKVIITANSFQYSLKALKNGVFDYLVYPIDIDELKSSFNRYKKGIKGNNYILKHELLTKLTERENDLVKLLMQGKSSKEIAAELNISKNTVNTHRHKIIEKAGVSSTLHLIAKLKGYN